MSTCVTACTSWPSAQKRTSLPSSTRLASRSDPHQLYFSFHKNGLPEVRYKQNIASQAAPHPWGSPGFSVGGLSDSICLCSLMRLTVSNAIKLTKNFLKEVRWRAFRVRKCRGFEKMCTPSRRRFLRLKAYRLSSSRNVHRRETVVGDFGTRIKATRPAWL